MADFGVISPRICPSFPTNSTIWWALMMDGYTADMLSAAQRAVVERIHGEPESILVNGGGDQVYWHRRPVD